MCVVLQPRDWYLLEISCSKYESLLCVLDWRRSLVLGTPTKRTEQTQDVRWFAATDLYPGVSITVFSSNGMADGTSSLIGLVWICRLQSPPVVLCDPSSGSERRLGYHEVCLVGAHQDCRKRRLNAEE